jgi:hypothetical protein
VRNRDIFLAGIVDNALIILTVIYLAFTSGLESWFISLSALLTGLFSVLPSLRSCQPGINW